MCFSNCRYESFNPLTGVCTCKRDTHPCPEESMTSICPYCDKEYEVPDDTDSLECPHCNRTLFT